jgi:putative ABC transport system permease protein
MKSTNLSDGPKPPPLWAAKLLEWLGDPDTREELQGDLLELYAYWVKTVGVRKARWRYGLSALKLVRPLAKRKETNYSIPFFLGPDMIRNYFKIALRNLAKNKVYSFINIGGLAVGMAVAMLIGLWVYDELSFDKSSPNYGRIAKVMLQQTVEGTTSTSEWGPIPLSTALKNDYGSDFSRIVLTHGTGEQILAQGTNQFTKKGYYAEPAFTEMLPLTMKRGIRTGLNDPSSILLSASMASALFGETDPINQLVKVNNKVAVKVCRGLRLIFRTIRSSGRWLMCCRGRNSLRIRNG